MLFTCRGQLHTDLTSILYPWRSHNQACFFATGYQRNRTMVLNLETLGNLADTGPVLSRTSFDMQQYQIMQRRQARTLRSFFAEFEKTTQLITKLRQRFEIIFLQRGRGTHTEPTKNRG